MEPRGEEAVAGCSWALGLQTPQFMGSKPELYYPHLLAAAVADEMWAGVFS